MAKPPEIDRNQAATIYVGNLDERCTDSLVWELFLQAGPIANIHLPKDRVTMSHQGYGFVEFLTEEDASYACKIMNQIKLYGKPIRVNKASTDRKPLDIGAKLFIGNLDPAVDERILYETFSHFGTLTTPATISRDGTTGNSKGFGFVSYDAFESSDRAIETMNNQFMMNKIITVQYALNKDAGKGERHGTAAERLLAAQARKNNALPAAPPPPPPPLQHSHGPPGSVAAPPPPPLPSSMPMYSTPPVSAPPPPGFQQAQYHHHHQSQYPPPPPPGFR